METQPKKMRSEAFSLGLTPHPVMLISRLSVTAAGLGQSWELLGNPVLEQCRACSSPFPLHLPPIFFPLNPFFPGKFHLYVTEVSFLNNQGQKQKKSRIEACLCSSGTKHSKGRGGRILPLV